MAKLLLRSYCRTQILSLGILSILRSHGVDIGSTEIIIRSAYYYVPIVMLIAVTFELLFYVIKFVFFFL